MADCYVTVKLVTTKGIEMRSHQLVTLLFAAAITTGAGLAVASPAQAEDPIVKLVSVQNGKCLQPVNGSLNAGDAIVQESCNGSLAQQWTVTGVSSTAVHLVNRSSNLCLDARGGATNGTPIQQWPCNWISNEKWGFGITNNLLGSQVSGTYSHCIATPGAQDGLPMELRFCDGNPAQLWNRPNG
ncbi:MAG: RICIN domain-containing protein [Sciscionella sp.]